MGNSMISSSDSWSIFNNTAGCLQQDQSFVSGLYFLHPYIDELDVKALGMALRKKNKLLGVSLTQQGDHRLNITESSFSYGQQFGKTLNLASSIHYRNYQLSDIYGSRQILFFSFGGQLKLNEKELLAFYIRNPLKQYIDRVNKERLQSFFAISYQHTFSSIFNTSFAIEKQSDQESYFRLAWKYQASQKFNIQGAYQSLFKRFNLSCEINIREIILFQSLNYDSIFGVTMGIGLSYKLGRKHV